MSLLFMDGFDHYASADLKEKWEADLTNPAITISASNGRYGTSAAIFNDEYTNQRFIQKYIGEKNTIILGFAIKLYKYPTGTSQPFLWFCQSVTHQLEFYLTLLGEIQVQRGGTVIGTTSGLSLSTSAYTYVEIKATIHDTTGSVEIRKNGIAVLSLSGVDTKNTTTSTIVSIIRFFSSLFYTYYLDDVYICDNSGSVNNDFLGDVTVKTIFPSGAGDTTQWTPSTGNNYECVDETNPSLSDYVSTSTLNNIDTYAYQDLSLLDGDVKGVQTNLLVKKSDAGTRKICAVARGSSDNLGVESSLFSEERYHSEIREINPETSNVWEVSEINNFKFGIKLST